MHLAETHTPQNKPLRRKLLSVAVILLGLAGSILTVVAWRHNEKIASRWQHPIVDPAGGFTHELPDLSIPSWGWAALSLLILGLALALWLAFTDGGIIFLAYLVVAIFAGGFIVMGPSLISIKASSSTSVKAFDTWSAERYGLDTTTLSEKDHMRLMKYRDAAVQLPDGQWIQAIQLKGRARYLVFSLGSEVPVIAVPAKAKVG